MNRQQFFLNSMKIELFINLNACCKECMRKQPVARKFMFVLRLVVFFLDSLGILISLKSMTPVLAMHDKWHI